MRAGNKISPFFFQFWVSFSLLKTNSKGRMRKGMFLNSEVFTRFPVGFVRPDLIPGFEYSEVNSRRRDFLLR